MKEKLKGIKSDQKRDLKNAKQLLAKIDLLEISNNTVDTKVREIKSLVSNTFLGDNKNRIYASAGNLNKDCNSKVSSAKSYTNSLIAKIENEITETDKQIKYVEEQEEKELLEELRKKNMIGVSIL